MKNKVQDPSQTGASHKLENWCMQLPSIMCLDLANVRDGSTANERAGPGF